MPDQRNSNSREPQDDRADDEQIRGIADEGDEFEDDDEDVDDEEEEDAESTF
jgi:hypothetical protein